MTNLQAIIVIATRLINNQDAYRLECEINDAYLDIQEAAGIVYEHNGIWADNDSDAAKLVAIVQYAKLLEEFSGLYDADDVEAMIDACRVALEDAETYLDGMYE